jgi:ATP-dependent DNA helicase PIF1
MHLLSATKFLRSPNGALRSPTRFIDAIMLNRAVNRYASTAQGEKTQTPLRLNAAAANVPRESTSNGMKRKFDRSMSTASSLGSLHQQTSFDENSPPGGYVDLTSPEKRSDIRYPSLHNLECEAYPKLPPLSKGSPGQPSSSAPVPWSSSPESHYNKPNTSMMTEEPPSPEPARPKKRKVLPSLFSSTSSRYGTNEDKSDHAGYGEKNKWAGTKHDKEHTGRFDKFTMSDMLERAPSVRQRSNTPVSRPSTSADRTISSVAKSTNTQKVTNDRLPEPFLSDEQKAVMKSVLEEGKSVFFTGSAGTGKSVLMRAIIAQLKHRFRKEPDRIAITASTGLASCILEGQTLHSWSGIGLGKEPAPELVKKIKRNQKSRQKWLRTKYLIIDEISMVDGQLFDKLEQVARTIRNNGRPFGGIQLVVTGDFFQLPPVPDKNSTAKFVFDAVTWNTCIQHTILLTHVFRQKDESFASMLNEMRLGKMSAATIREFKSLSRPLNFRDELEATEL